MQADPSCQSQVYLSCDSLYWINDGDCHRYPLDHLPKVVRWHFHASQPMNSPAGLQFGQITECPSPVLKAQFGDRLLVEMESSQIQHVRAGDWIDGDWRLLAYRDQRFIFKNSLGRTCVQKSL